LSLRNNITRRLSAAMVCAGLVLGATGCRHKVRVAPLPPVLVPIALIDVPRPANPPMLAAPHLKMPPTPIAAAAATLPRERKRPPVVKVEPAPPVVTPPPVPDAAAIGSLTAGGTANPQTRQDATDLIASNEKRLNALSPQKAEEQKAEISTVKNLQKQAQDALGSGDAEGAVTLATKVKVMLDDLEK
jgi:hypothetical protein